MDGELREMAEKAGLHRSQYRVGSRFAHRWDGDDSHLDAFAALIIEREKGLGRKPTEEANALGASSPAPLSSALAEGRRDVTPDPTTPSAAQREEWKRLAALRESTPGSHHDAQFVIECDILAAFPDVLRALEAVEAELVVANAAKQAFKDALADNYVGLRAENEHLRETIAKMAGMSNA